MNTNIKKIFDKMKKLVYNTNVTSMNLNMAKEYYLKLQIYGRKLNNRLELLILEKNYLLNLIEKEEDEIKKNNLITHYNNQLIMYDTEIRRINFSILNNNKLMKEYESSIKYFRTTLKQDMRNIELYKRQHEKILYGNH